MNQTSALSKIFLHAARTLHLLAMLMAVLLTTGHVDLAWPLDDAFQEAEWAINRSQLRPPGAQPVLIHGGLDQLPATIAAAACPPTAQIACLRAINLGTQILAGWTLIALLALLTGLGTGRAWLASLPTILTVVIMAAAASTPVLGQQSAPGTRDLPVLAGLFPMILIARRLDRAEPTTWPLPALLGAIAAAAPFWAYNRGIVTIAATGAFALGAAIIRRSPRPALQILAGGAFGLALIAATLGPQIVATTASNILYWAQNAALWHIPPSKRALAEAALPFAAAALMLLLTRPRQPGTRLLIATLVTIFVLYVAQSLDRADASHLRWTLWPATLLLAIAIRALPGKPRITAPAIAAALLLTIAPAIALTEPHTNWNIAAGWRSNLHTARTGWPNDTTLAGPTLARVASLVRNAGRCTFAANNAAIVYLLANQPPCTAFAVAAYIAPTRQNQVIAELEAAQPAIILWDAPNWWAHIDGHTLPSRNPALAAWIVDHYPITTTIDGQTLRSKTPLTP